jgi:hypothetical protein
MHEQIIGEVSMIAIEPQVVKLGRWVCYLTDKALQYNGFDSYVDRFSTDRTSWDHPHIWGTVPAYCFD